MEEEVSKLTLEEDQLKQKPFVVSVEGNIGSGKSSMLKVFENMTDKVTTVPEPVEEWQDLNGHNLLHKLYEDPGRWSFQFQSYIQLTRLRLLKSPTDKPVKLLERSIQNNRFCFLELAKRQGSLTLPELSVLYSWYDFLDQNMGLDLDLIVYLRADPEVSYERMRNRGRSEESEVPLDFITSLHNVYEDWLIEQKFGEINVPVLVMDANKSKEELMKIYQQEKDKIFGQKAMKSGQIEHCYTLFKGECLI